MDEKREAGDQRHQLGHGRTLADNHPGDRGEGGFLALFAGALDTRIDAVCVSGSFDEREGVWREPIDRNVFGLLEQFGDAELAAMVAPRGLTVEAARGPQVVIPPGTGGGPGKLETPALVRVRREFARAGRLVEGLESPESASADS